MGIESGMTVRRRDVVDRYGHVLRVDGDEALVDWGTVTRWEPITNLIALA